MIGGSVNEFWWRRKITNFGLLCLQSRKARERELYLEKSMQVDELWEYRTLRVIN